MEVYSSQPDAPELPLGGLMPNDDPVQIKNIDGLGPVVASITTTPYATGRGELYQGSSVGKRNIVLTLGYNPDWAGLQTIGTLRQLLYRYLMPEAWCKLRFFTDELPPVDIEGYVESFEPNIFSEDPEVQISVLCPKPDFVDANATLIEGVVDNGTIEQEFIYTGTVDTGYELVIKETDDNPAYSGNLAVVSTAQEQVQIFEINPISVDGTKYFKLSTIRGAKRAQTVSVADGALTNLLSGITSDSVWPVVKPGQNTLSVIASENGQAWTLAYFNRFGGL